MGMSKNQTEIGEIGNYYGCLTVKSEGKKFYWSIENWDGHCWEEIPENLFEALVNLEKTVKKHRVDISKSEIEWLGERIEELEAMLDEMADGTQDLVDLSKKPNEGYAEASDRYADMFYKETGKMAPYKATPLPAPELGATPEQYQEWVDGKLNRCRSLLKKYRDNLGS
jgi:hypothetical protein